MTFEAIQTAQSGSGMLPLVVAVAVILADAVLRVLLWPFRRRRSRRKARAVDYWIGAGLFLAFGSFIYFLDTQR